MYMIMVIDMYTSTVTCVYHEVCNPIVSHISEYIII